MEWQSFWVFPLQTGNHDRSGDRKYNRLAVHFRQLEVSFGDESVHEAYSGAPRLCICMMVAVTDTQLSNV